MGEDGKENRAKMTNTASYCEFSTNRCHTLLSHVPMTTVTVITHRRDRQEPR